MLYFGLEGKGNSSWECQNAKGPRNGKKPIPRLKTPFGTLTAWMLLALLFEAFLPLNGLQHYYGGYVMGHDDAINPHHRLNELKLAKMLFDDGLVSDAFLLLALIKPLKRFLDDMTPPLLIVFIIIFGITLMVVN